MLIDVDGVISLFGFDLAAPPPGRYATVEGIPHFLAAQTADFLTRLEASFDCAWCTGWEERAPEHLPHLLGLRTPPFPYLRLGAQPLPRAHWKLAAIDAYAGADRALAWIDDAHDEHTGAWADDRPGRTLLVHTDAAVGITEDHVAQLERWARSTET